MQEPRDASGKFPAAVTRTTTAHQPDPPQNRFFMSGYDDNDSLDSLLPPMIVMPRDEPQREGGRLSKTDWEKLMREDDFDQLLDEADLDEDVDDVEGDKDFRLDDDWVGDGAVGLPSDTEFPKRRSVRVEIASAKKSNAMGAATKQGEGKIAPRRGKRKRQQRQVELSGLSSYDDYDVPNAAISQPDKSGTHDRTPKSRPKVKAWLSKLHPKPEQELGIDDGPDEVPSRARGRPGVPPPKTDRPKEIPNHHSSTSLGHSKQPEHSAQPAAAQASAVAFTSQSAAVGMPFSSIQYMEPEGDDEMEFHFRLRQLELDRQLVCVELEEYRWQKRTTALALARRLADHDWWMDAKFMSIWRIGLDMLLPVDEYSRAAA